MASINDGSHPCSAWTKLAARAEVLSSALLKRWILGTHHGSVQPEHLDAYLDEFVFRFNRRSSASRGMLFYRLLQQAVVTDPVTYADIVQTAA